MKQIFVINKDLKMSKGKIAVQVAHGETYYMNKVLEITSYLLHESYGNPRIPKLKIKKEEQFHFLSSNHTWFDSNMTKIILKATEQEIIEFETNLKEKGIWTHRIYDLGLTQVPENSFTCLVVEPLEQTFNQFKLL